VAGYREWNDTIGSHWYLFYLLDVSSQPLTIEYIASSKSKDVKGKDLSMTLSLMKA